MNAGVADEDEETDSEEKLGDSGEVKRSGVREDRHGCERLGMEEVKATLEGSLHGEVGWRLIYRDAVLERDESASSLGTEVVRLCVTRRTDPEWRANMIYAC